MKLASLKSVGCRAKGRFRGDPKMQNIGKIMAVSCRIPLFLGKVCFYSIWPSTDGMRLTHQRGKSAFFLKVYCLKWKFHILQSHSNENSTVLAQKQT
jgi:hypothetical protein